MFVAQILSKVFLIVVIGTACTVRGAGFMHLSGVRPSVGLSVRMSRPTATRRCCVFAVVDPATRRRQSIAARAAGRRSAAAAPQQMRAVPRCQST